MHLAYVWLHFCVMADEHTGKAKLMFRTTAHQVTDNMELFAGKLRSPSALCICLSGYVT
jgi:hypothetical protein